MAGGDSCNLLVLGVGIFLPEARLEAPSPDAGYAVVEPRYQFAPRTLEIGPADEPGQKASLENRPLSTALRI
jgi:hypothetical protein